ncbi:MAG TPA: C1 family peptidase [Gemmatimonadaceae bacterium]|nr:C1 family peptidase [Gemmatimonadaceae bacterium]
MARTKFTIGAGPSLASLERLRAETAQARVDALSGLAMMSLSAPEAFGAATSATLRELAAELPVRTQPNGDPRCVAYAFATAMDLCALAETGVDPDLHDRFSVDDAWVQMKKKPKIPNGVAAVGAGITDEACWPHGAAAGCPDVATRRFRARVEQPVATNAQHLVPLLCEALDRNVPLVTGVPIFTNFPKFKESGLFRAKGSVVGAHALVIVDYEEDAHGAGGCWVALNSWGVDWGDGGLVRIAWNDVDLRPEAALFMVSAISEA